MTRLVLRKPLERHLQAGHPWIYRDAVQSIDGQPGEAATVVDRQGRFIARGLLEEGPIALRVFTLVDEPLDEKLFARRLDRALELRERLELGESNSYRLVHGEGDRLPGIVVDRYADFAMMRLDGAAASAHAEVFARLLRPRLEAVGVSSLLLKTGRRGDASTRLLWGEQPPERLVVLERGMRLHVSLMHGQKTGMFLDHRESRRRVRGLSRGLRVLNLYGYNGGFSIAAGLGGALHVTTVDVAKPALDFAESAWLDNGLPSDRHEAIAADVGDYLKEASGPRPDVIIADPPNFAPRETAVADALGAYQRLHRACLTRLPPGGIYLAASCSSHIDGSAFDASLREAAADARLIVQRLGSWGAPADHPRIDALVQSHYLKVRLLRRIA